MSAANAVAIARAETPDTPIAHLRWGSRGPTVQRLAHDRTLDVLLRRARWRRPHAVRRERSGGQEQLYLDPLPPTAPGFYASWATELSFAQRGHAHFVMTACHTDGIIEDDADFWALEDMLTESHRPTPDVQCPCGSRVVLGEAACPACGGVEPMGRMLAAHGDTLDAALHYEVTRRLGNDATLAVAQSVRQGLNQLPREGPPSALETDGPNDHPRRMIRHFDRTLSLEAVDWSWLAELRDTIPDSRAILQKAEAVSVAVRRWWLPNTSAGWVAGSIDRKEQAQQRKARWTETAQHLAAVGAAYQRCAAAYAPVRRILARDHGMTVGKALKWLWKGTKAVMTSGASLLWDGAIGLAKNHREEKAFTRLDEELRQMWGQVERAEQRLADARERQRAADDTHRRAATAFLKAGLLADYATVPIAQRLPLVRRLADHLEVGFSCPEPGARLWWTNPAVWVGAGLVLTLLLWAIF